ncbi:quinone oxidoreductase family protein [Streptomyces nigrescens]|uniref:Oxidoreductase n=1 Tax=Streptomyces nigrescens TaxID=1920 RepID=A0A640TCD6_STRNI|nr:zinc-binding dehydrogenase [Streptomyces libani]WAT95713.1 zinc-binding dehydrogenase [Streptomyces libani subsp. libani]GFE20978.1 oxidoreductase [Streptomyces libani subsp. libani]GGV88637.1 oxidoreductase [Streptomyces libani subsp. libani]
MRRVRFHSYGGPDVLRVEETAEEPVPGPGELLVRTEAIGVTLPCVRRVRGDGNGGGDPLPSMPGGEIAGTVVALGPDVTGFAPGDRVTSLTFTGSYTELALAPAFLASQIPDGASAVEAVALVRSGHVALAALSTAAPRGAESVLITGAAGATGHLAVQLAKLQGVPRVVAVVSSAAKAEFLRGLGADEVVTYDQESWGAPADIVLDGVGGELLPRALAALAPGGRLIFFNSGGGTVPAYELLAGDKTITGLTMRRFSTVQRELYEEHRAQLWELAGSGRLRAAVHAELPLDEAAKAHEIIEARANLGKVVLRP